MTACKAIHTRFQPKDDWACPFCEGRSIYLKERAPDVSPHCQKLHSGDFYFCSDCEIVAPGRDLAYFLNQCPMCNGTGKI